MNNDRWQTKMIYVLMVWCAMLALWNVWQAYQIQDLLGMVMYLRRAVL